MVRGLRVLTGLPGRIGRHRRPDPPVKVTLVLSDGSEIHVPVDTPLSRSMGALAALVAHW
jgi:hypothetical protein